MKIYVKFFWNSLYIGAFWSKYYHRLYIHCVPCIAIVFDWHEKERHYYDIAGDVWQEEYDHC